ncbi:type I glutamate--ammonia ligase [Candidatus Woesearchaeota archaeon]|nr:type I glutamate--ammonia ligase [Candidatus Woesearchaeota archaeon]
MEIQEILERVKEDKVEFISLQFSDIMGTTKSLTIPVEHIKTALTEGIWFDGSSVEGFLRIHESDMLLKPDTTTYAIIPWLTNQNGTTCRFICDVHLPDGKPFMGDPRQILKKAISEAEAMGYTYKTGPELEFFLFKVDNGSVKPLSHDVGGYFDLSLDKAYNIRRDMTYALEKLGIEVEASHHEVAQGQHEIDFKYGDALRTADNAMTFRFALKAIAEQHGLYATFMPKPIFGINGSGMHVHQSLFDKNGNNAFFDKHDKYNLSKVAKSFIAGQLEHVKAMSAVLAPTVNSYKRLVPGYEAPVYICWGQVNRSALIRVPRHKEGKSQATRAELRCPDPSCNPYLAFAVMLKAGLDGIKRNLVPPEPVEEDVYDFDDRKLKDLNITVLPHSLWEAISEMKKDKTVHDALGDHTFHKFIEAKIQEWDSYRISVTDWEIKRYLEVT